MPLALPLVHNMHTQIYQQQYNLEIKSKVQNSRTFLDITVNSCRLHYAFLFSNHLSLHIDLKVYQEEATLANKINSLHTDTKEFLNNCKCL